MDKRLRQTAGLLPIREARLSAEDWMSGGWKMVCRAGGSAARPGHPSITTSHREEE